MKTADVLAGIVTQGWQDDSRYTRTHTNEQVSCVNDGFQKTLSFRADGTFVWTVIDLTDKQKYKVGSTTSLNSAYTECHNAFSAMNGTLF